MEKIKWGIIGCGDVTEKKSGPAFNKVAGSELVAVMRRDAAKAADYAKRHQVPKWYSKADELINDPEINAIYIATPPLQHEEYAVKAMAAGKPVYVEKPISLSAASARRILEASKKYQQKVSVAHYRRQQPVFLKVKELLESKAIGEVRFVDLQMLQPPKSNLIASSEKNWRVDPVISGGGLFHDLAPHQLDLMVYFFGEVKEASGFGLNQGGFYEADDLVTGNILFKNKVVFTGTWCFTVAEGGQQDICTIIGSEGKISFPVFSSEITLTQNGQVEKLNFEPLAHVQQPMIAKVVQYFLGRSPNPCSVQDAIYSMELMDTFTQKKE
ncbi:Gfo/Idh/MocA family protein [Mucilaginibacter arboris]|uniref:Gfo/Idh/MocA family oxidoreductase n=1 Tax=Mucilaginibacter arboris TaxID=2682090 RepID=A0A7K1T1K1_9SPHI|nr:Gfo/Idh/MocA family oxidoreductase [Mucilaginibacter arboris]MVN23434.1 gfo/Idh/MocA family oxidoreductase [Mucilaginibacter arboris]